MMWLVLEDRKVEKQLEKCPESIQEEYELWKQLIEHSGPAAPRNIRGYRDHALSGPWKGARSSSLDYKWRVIYIISNQRVEVIVLEVTPHDYRKRS